MAKTLPVWQQVLVGLLIGGAMISICTRAKEKTASAPVKIELPERSVPAEPAPILDEPEPVREPAPTTPIQLFEREPMTVRGFKKSSKEAQVAAVRERWTENADEPTLGRLVAAARAGNTEIDTIAGIYECTTRVVSKNKEIMKVFKELDVVDAHKLAEPSRSIDDVVDTCMVMLLALAQN